MNRSIKFLALVLLFLVFLAPVSYSAVPLMPSLAPLVKVVSPSIVQIHTTIRNIGTFETSEGKRFKRQIEDSHSAGSGIIISETYGRIITNNHVAVADPLETDISPQLNELVVKGEDLPAGTQLIAIESTVRSMYVSISTMPNVRVFAKLVGADKNSDLAVIKVCEVLCTKITQYLNSIDLGDSDKVQVGDFVMAVGNPFDVGESVTLGIISARDRSFGGERGQIIHEKMLQTDAAINPGNSGGALIDVNSGKVIGMNQSIAAPDRASSGVGFAIPSNVIRYITDLLINDGKVTWATIGVEVETGGDFLQVKNVLPGGAAERARVQAGDVITEIDDIPVYNIGDLWNYILFKKSGDVVKLVVNRYFPTQGMGHATIPVTLQ